jgi:hypothetical protein
VKRRHCRAGDREWGRVCVCGGPKSLQAWICQRCRTLEKRSPVSARERGRISEARYMGWAVPVGDPDAARVARDRELAAARANVAGEIAELAAAQVEDERLGHLSRARWIVSLDDVDPFGRPLYDLVAA